MTIYIVNNIWEMFISILDIFEKKEKKYLVLINEIFIDKKITEILEKEKIIFYKIPENKFQKLILYYWRKNIYLPKLIDNKYFKEKELKIISFSDQDVVTRFFIDKGYRITLYEHGLINYEENFGGIIYNFKRYLLKMGKPYGRIEAVNDIFLKFPEKAPEDIKNKVKKLDLIGKIEKLTLKEKEKILKNFSFKKIPEKEWILLLTQPLEIKRCSEQEKIEIYTKLYLEYSKEYTVYIKPHPLEKSDYTKLTLNIIDKNIPIEILLLETNVPKMVVTLFSSGATIFSTITELKFLGWNNFEKKSENLNMIEKFKI